MHYLNRLVVIDERRGVTKNSMCGSCGKEIAVFSEIRPTTAARYTHRPRLKLLTPSFCHTINYCIYLQVIPEVPLFETQRCYVQTQPNQPYRVSAPSAYIVQTPIRAAAVERKLRDRVTGLVKSVLRGAGG